MNNEKWEYKIDGKKYGMARLVVTGLFGIIFTVLAIDQFQPHPNKYIPVALAFTGMAVSLIGAFVYLLIRYNNFKIYIGKEGFYYQTTRSNGTYYSYDETENAQEIVESYKHGGTRGARGRVYYHFLVFSLNNGEQKKVLFEKTLHEKEIKILIKRINKK